MDPNQLRGLLDRVRSGAVAIDEALDSLRTLPFEALEHATVDHHRALRLGAPEVIYGEHKTSEQIAGVALSISGRGQNVLITRLDAEKARALEGSVPGFEYRQTARTGSVKVAPVPARPGTVLVVTAGTSDQPIAEEAFETLTLVGLGSSRMYDVGVAGIHRLLGRVNELRDASAIIVVAGMEGALPGVIGGLVGAPVIAVPTSVGYGTSAHGFAALFSMLSCCASGIAVVNIDNGFGAAMVAHRMLPKSGEFR